MYTWTTMDIAPAISLITGPDSIGHPVRYVLKKINKTQFDKTFTNNDYIVYFVRLKIFLLINNMLLSTTHQHGEKQQSDNCIHTDDYLDINHRLDDVEKIIMIPVFKNIRILIRNTLYHFTFYNF